MEAVPAPVAPDNTAFFLIAERGILEAQAVLLCQSIRKFAGAYSKSPITVISPRRNCRPCRETSRKLVRLEVEYLELRLPSPCPSYGPSFRVLAAARMEQQATAAVLVQLDSDTIFVREPDFRLAGAHAAARPVDVRGMCTEGTGDRFDPYWRTLCKMCGVDYESIPWVTTTVDDKVVRANYNGGLIAVRRASGLMRQTEEFFLCLVAENHRPWANSGTLMKTGAGAVDRMGSEFWGTSQAVFSLAVTARGGPMQILPNSYNIPLHYFDSLPIPAAAPIHLHYHWLCSEGECANNPMLDGRLALPPEVDAWLRRELPLRAPRLTALEKLMKSKFLAARS
jgi:hypothetical protein